MKPMLATLVKEPFDDKDWIFETKWDGFRAIAHKSKKVELLSRNEKSFNLRFPQIVKELEQLPGNFIVDGEIVIFDEKKRSSFQLLQNYNDTKKGIPRFCIFDLMSYQGKDLTHLPLSKRKELLKKILGKKKWKHLIFSDHVDKKGKQLFEKAKKKNLEGIIAKRKNSSYQPSVRSRDWLKIKTKMRQEFVIGGFTEPRGGRLGFGALLIGYYEKGKFVYAGHVGGGFNVSLLKKLYQQMTRLKRQKCPFVNEPKPNTPVTWIQPKLICEVAFAEWTQDGILRQPIFQGLRSDKSPKSISREI